MRKNIGWLAFLFLMTTCFYGCGTTGANSSGSNAGTSGTGGNTGTGGTSGTGGSSGTGGTGTSSPSLGAGTYTFFAAGEDAQSRPYGIAGSITLNSTGGVTAGEQDYNSAGGPASPEPTPDSITGGQLTASTNGQASLTLVTSNTNLGVKGTESFSISVVNSKHALIGQFDASATSSGSLDLQTLSPGGLDQINGPMAMVVSGKSGSLTEIFGGVVTGDGSGNLHVQIDQNENGTISRGGSNTGTYTAPDAKGRGTLSFGGDNFAYYVVGAKAMRLLVVNGSTPDIGSAFAGVTGASDSTLSTKFVFSDGSSAASAALFSAAGFMTMDGKGNVSGFSDVNENGHPTSAAFQGTYSVASSGYSTITITPGNTQDVSLLGLYLTDPSVNLEDPNNTAGGGQGLIIDLDSTIDGSGLLILPPSGSTTLTGTYGWGAQTFASGHELDAVGYVTITSGAASGAVNLNDLFNTGQDKSIAIAGTITADSNNAGRFTIPLTVSVGTSPAAASYVLYQVSSTELIVIDNAATQFGLGVMEQQQ